jgi:CHASE3 domain.
LVAIGVASYYSFSGLLKTQEWVTHTQEDLHLLNRLLSEIEIAGSEQRLYLITGQERYIDSYSEYRQRALTTL